jgi:hypothetical protein
MPSFDPPPPGPDESEPMTLPEVPSKGSPVAPGPDESEPSPGVAAGVGSALSPPPGGLPIMLGDYGDGAGDPGDDAPSPSDDPPAPGE